VLSVDLDTAREFLGQHHRGVLATRRSDGGLQQSPVLVNVDGEGRPIISSRETAYKVRNLRRDPWAQACVFTNRFFGSWIFVEGTGRCAVAATGDGASDRLLQALPR
jgi:PPOX class probable F420-dependent enzyme